MKEFKYARTTLQTLQWGTRFTYTLFLLFCLTSYLVMAIMVVSRTGLGGQSIAEYYRGDGSEFWYGKTEQEMLEVTHFHLFSIPILLFVQGHLFMLCAWATRWKVPILLAAFLGGAIEIAAPWLIIKVSGDFAFLKNVGRLLLLVSLTLFAFVPIYEMWFRRVPSAAARPQEVQNPI